MRKFLILFALAFFLNTVSGQHAGYKLVSNTATFKTQFAAASQKINTIASDFIQQKNLSMLADKITSKGKFYFRKENCVRMEYASPYQYLMIINGSKVFVKDGQKTNTMSAKSNKMFQQVNQLMMDCAKGTVFDNKSFSVKLFESGSNYLAEMTPVTKEMKALFSKVNVIMAKSNFIVHQVQMTEPSGDNTVITYSNQKFNTNLPDALFTAR
jgi:outer membrane lipoprotein-sorting protein